jgi:hypothetical protein
VVLAGEDGNDRSSLRVLLEADCPEMRGRLVEIKDSVRLHGASDATLALRADVLVRKARARAEFEHAQLACLVVHEDWDRVDGESWDVARARVQKALAAAAGSAHYVLAAWEIEAWLLQFPDALAAEVSSWVVPRKYRGRDTGTLRDPKKILASECGGRGRRYRESDAPAVLRNAANDGLLDQPVGSNRSWTTFRDEIAMCCASHLRSAGRRRKA